MTTTAAITSRSSHGHSGVPELSAGAADPPLLAAEVVVGVDVTVVVCVLVFVAVDVWVEVCVDVSVDVCVLVEVSVVVDVVCVEDVRVGKVRVALGVGPSDGASIEIVRDAVGRLLAPPHATSGANKTPAATTKAAVLPRITFDRPSFVSRSPGER